MGIDSGIKLMFENRVKRLQAFRISNKLLTGADVLATVSLESVHFNN